jgi:FkbM family methyltransferase
MLISLDELIKKYNISFKGILHVGAHECEELQLYEKYIDRSNILWVDALLDKVIANKNKYENLLIEHAVVSDKVENLKFYRSNNDQSSSIFNLGLHKQFHPEVHYVNYYNVETIMLNSILPKYNINYNFINLDIQGAELKALKGMESYLEKIDYIYSEVNEDYVYEGCNLITEIDDYLNKFNFKRVETAWYGNCKWGDAFYIKNNLLN